MKEGETKKEKFKRLAEARTNKIIKTMQLLGNCTNTNNYEYTKKEADKIISVIEDELRKLKFKFKENYNNDDEFRL